MTQPSTNLAAALHAAGTDVVVEERPIPTPGPDEVLVSNKFVAINPIDWKRQATGMMIQSYPLINGTDLSGVVVSVGADVKHVQPGDRVLGAAPQVRTGNPDHGAFQQFTLTKATTTSKLPAGVGLDAGAAVVTGIATAAHALIDVFGLPRTALEPGPSPPPADEGPSILVWGGASNVGIMTIQLARLAGLRVSATASERHHEYLRSLGARVLVDYRSPTAVGDLVAAAEAAQSPFRYVVDAISAPDTLKSCLEVLGQAHGVPFKKLCHTAPWPEALPVPEGVETGWVRSSDVWSRTEDLGVWLFHEALPAWLERGVVKASPVRVVDGGVGGVQNALNEVKKGTSAEKVIVAF